MLQALRRSTSSWIMKAILGLLALTFVAFFGVGRGPGGLSGRGGNVNAVVQVGGVDIGAQEVSRGGRDLRRGAGAHEAADRTNRRDAGIDATLRRSHRGRRRVRYHVRLAVIRNREERLSGEPEIQPSMAVARAWAAVWPRLEAVAAPCHMGL